MKFKDFLKQNKNKNEDEINEKLIYDLRNEPLVGYIIDAFRTLESCHLKVVDWELITDESKIDTETVNVRHIKNKKNKKIIKRLPINISRYDLLKIKFHLSAVDGEKYKTIKLLLFKKTNKYYYIIDGNRFYPIYQLLESSTYCRRNYLTLKTLLLPIRIKKQELTKDEEKIIFEDQTSVYVPTYNLCIFNNIINPLYFYLALMGYENTLIYMDMKDIIKIEPFRKYDKDEYYCIKSEGGLYIKVIKYFFDNDNFIRFMTNALREVTRFCTNIRDLNDHNFWVCSLGELMMVNPEEKDITKLYTKGKNVLFSFSRLLDNITKNNLKLEYKNRANIFAVVRWMLRNFDELKNKDNMDILNKRVRIPEYMAAYLIAKLSPRMTKFIANDNVKLKDVELLINMEQDYLLKTVKGSKKPLLRYDDNVNDLDMFTALKYTVKGPGSIGGKSGKSINDKYRGVDTSHVGILDLNTSSNSDPGMSGILCPFIKLYGKFLSPNDEPQSWDKNFENLYENYFNGKHKKTYSLNYFYDLEKQSAKKIKNLRNIRHFIDKDPYYFEKNVELVGLSPYDKVKRVYVYKKGSEEPEIVNVKELKSKKKKRKNKRKRKNKIVNKKHIVTICHKKNK